MRFLVSGSTCKGLGSHHSMLKGDQSGKSTTFLGSLREGRTPGKPAATKNRGTDRQTDTESRGSPTAREGNPEVQRLDCCKHNSDDCGATNSREPPLGEVHSRSLSRRPVSAGEKPCMRRQREQERNHFDISQRTLI